MPAWSMTLKLSVKGRQDCTIALINALEPLRWIIIAADQQQNRDLSLVNLWKGLERSPGHQTLPVLLWPSYFCAYNPPLTLARTSREIRAPQSVCGLERCSASPRPRVP